MKYKAKKRQGKPNADHSGRDGKPLVWDMTVPQHSCGGEFIHGDTRCHNNNQESDGLKAEWTFPEREDRSKGAASKAA